MLATTQVVQSTVQERCVLMDSAVVTAEEINQFLFDLANARDTETLCIPESNWCITLDDLRLGSMHVCTATNANALPDRAFASRNLLLACLTLWFKKKILISNVREKSTIVPICVESDTAFLFHEEDGDIGKVWVSVDDRLEHGCTIALGSVHEAVAAGSDVCFQVPSFHSTSR